MVDSIQRQNVSESPKERKVVGLNYVRIAAASLASPPVHAALDHLLKHLNAVRWDAVCLNLLHFLA